MVLSCLLANCWNDSYDLAVIVKVPTFVPLPVRIDPEQSALIQLLRYKRDFFGITAAIVAAIAVSAATAATASVAMVNTVQTVECRVNTIVAKTATALEIQQTFDEHIRAGVLLVNQS